MGHPATRGARRLAVGLIVAAGLFGACGEAAPSSAPPVARATPVVTPNPHLAEPATADQVFLGLARAGLRLTANNADAGAPDSGLVKRINATFLGWPFAVSQFESSSKLRDVLDWAEAGAPGQGEPPVAIAGMNVLIEWGPTTGEAPPDVDPERLEALADMAATLDALVSPLRARAVVAVPHAGAVAGSDASPAPEESAEATPEP